MKKLKHYWSHCNHAVRYGKWYCGWKTYEDKPMFGFFHTYYDGDHVSFHLYKFWIGVSY